MSKWAKIIRCYNDKAWYKDNIGDEIRVEDETSSFYLADVFVGGKCRRGFVDKSDCKIINH